MKAKKSYGQHFLVHDSTALQIAEFIDYLGDKINVIEVGPGRGILTQFLLQRKYNLKAVEADLDMVNYLKSQFQVNDDNLIHLDFLKINMSKLFDGEEFVIIGNFPYNISSQIVFKMIYAKELVPEMVGMFQREMAERIIAPPGSKEYGVISVLTQAYYEGSMLLKLPPGAFSPPPKVNSAVIRLKRKINFNLECDERLFRLIVKNSFNQRRKMLRNTIKPLLIDSGILNDEYFNLRPEQLSVQEFITLTNKIQNNIKNEFRNQNNGRP